MPDEFQRSLLNIIADVLGRVLFSPIFRLIFDKFEGARHWLQVFFSGKTNIVVGYNTQGLEDDNFDKKYSSFINQLENLISEYELSNKIKIHKLPASTRFSGRSAAEARVYLSLRGSILLVWGHVFRKKGKLRFKTLFSYEFEYPSFIKEEVAKEKFSNYIQKYLGSGLYSINKNDEINPDTFGHNTLETCLFILGIINLSRRDDDKAELFFKKFLDLYKEEEILRKKELGPTYMEVIHELKGIYVRKVQKYWTRNPLEFKKNNDNIISIAPKDYYALINLAFYYYSYENNKTKALEYSKKAESNAPRGLDLHKFNNAFFRLTEGDYIKALGIYESIPLGTKTNTEVVRESIYREYKKTNNPLWLFIEGFIVYRWGDEEEGKDLLKKFLTERENGFSNKYLDLVDKASALIGN